MSYRDWVVSYKSIDGKKTGWLFAKGRTSEEAIKSGIFYLSKRMNINRLIFSAEETEWQ